jgi:hypothetical protein
MDRIFVSFGNLKLPKDTMIFNIPAVTTCPGRTELCARVCYALKTERYNPHALPARQGNFDASRRPDFPARMIEIIRAKASKIRRVRVHESGDFYNQAYLNAWFSIAAALPGIRFYAYSKSFHLDFTGRPSNFWLIASYDSTSKRLAPGGSSLFQNSFTIVESGGKCPMDCSICSLCWTGRGRRLTVDRH